MRIYNTLKRSDHILTGAVVLLCLMGLIALSSVAAFTGSNGLIIRQGSGCILGVCIMFALSFLNLKVVTRPLWFYYALTNILLLMVLVAGSSGGGAKRWFSVGSLTFQPSEVTKILLILFYAEFIIKYKEKLQNLLLMLISLLLVLPSVLMILLEPDLSTAIVTTLIFCVIIFIAGLDWKIVGGLLAVSVPSACIFILLAVYDRIPFLSAYQRNRILAWLHPEDYASSTAYQTMNSITAIGSGRIFGKGYEIDQVSSLVGSGFVSESQTDFIFAVIGEQFGWIGCCTVLLLITAVTVRCFLIASRAECLSEKIIASGVGAWIGFQSYINIGVTTGILPNTGLPLPFVSYGLTSLICLFTGLGFVQGIYITYNKQQPKYNHEKGRA